MQDEARVTVNPGLANAYLMLAIAASIIPWERGPAAGLGGALASALVELEDFDWVPETELELHAVRASVLAVSRRSPEPRRRFRRRCIVRPPAFQSRLKN